VGGTVKHRGRMFAAAGFAAALITSAGVSAGPASATPGFGAKTITLGLITSLTGAASAEYGGVIPAAEARVDLQNAEGGVDGRKIRLITEDDQSSPSQANTAAELLISKGVFGIIDESALVFGAAQTMQKAGIPVVGGGYDGPEWGMQPYTNMFSTSGPVDPHEPANTGTALFMKKLGVTSVAAFGYASSPSSTAAATGFYLSAKVVGLTQGYLNTTIPFGSVNVTPIALQMKADNINGVYLPLDDNTNFAILTAAKQAGVNIKVAISATGYGQALLDDPTAVADAQGDYFPPPGVPVELKTPATKAFQAALAKYAHFKGIPSFDYYEGWTGADLMIKGIELAGKHPTQQSFITNLHKVSNYNAGGLEGSANLTLKAFGTAPQTLCGWETKLVGKKFVPVPANGTKVCGTLIPNSNQS
jgi:branched-chain amino acid transport system substrate-binding protein